MLPQLDHPAHITLNVDHPQKRAARNYCSEDEKLIWNKQKQLYQVTQPGLFMVTLSPKVFIDTPSHAEALIY